MIEQAFKYGFGAAVPEELSDWTGSSELTNFDAEEFVQIVEDLERALMEMGRWNFAEEYCDPREVERAKLELGK